MWLCLLRALTLTVRNVVYSHTLHCYGAVARAECVCVDACDSPFCYYPRMLYNYNSRSALEGAALNCPYGNCLDQ